MSDGYTQEKTFCNGECRDMRYHDISTPGRAVCIDCGHVETGVLCKVPYTEFDWLNRDKPHRWDAGTIHEPCPACGHMASMHPGPGNPSLATCALCQVLAASATRS